VPELPEVETVRRGLAERVVGRLITEVSVGRPRSVRRTSPAELIARTRNTRVESVDRRGKYIVGRLDSGDGLMIHLRMSGQLLVDRVGAPRPTHTHVVFELDGRDELRFVDPRTFGEVVAFDPDEADRVVPELGRLGVDPVAESLELPRLRRLLGSTRRPVKAMLLDQTLIAGIGNIYGDEILHRAGVDPRRPAADVNAAQSKRLHRSIAEVLGEAIAAGGSTLGDAQYVDLMGEGGSFQDQHRVYGRAGARCVTCARGVVVAALIGGRTSSWCRVCQR